MREKERTTFRKIELHRKEGFYLIVRGLEVGIAAGLVSVLYRFLLSFAENHLYRILDFIKGNPIRIILWLILVSAIGVGVYFITKWEPKASGSGIPQINGEIKGYMSPTWWRVILGKLIGGTASVFSGLSLGREGPSVQLGGMAGKGVARITKADKTTELRMISCGAGAGMSAAFNAPLAAIMFVLEEIHHTFDKSILCMGIVAAITADFISKLFFGQSTVFNYDTVIFPLKYYWILILMGILLGISGILYNLIMVKAQDIYKSIKKIPNYIKLPAVFLISGIVGLIMPEILCGGHSMETLLMENRPPITALLLLVSAKFLFGAICFASGAPGGTLYPLCILGAYLGAIFGTASIHIFDLGSQFWEEFVVIGMAGFFSAIVRTPITGIVLVFELTGNMSNLLPIATVSLISYATANLIGVNPFYETLLERMTADSKSAPVFHKTDEKVLKTYILPVGSPIAKKRIMDVDWGKHCLVVSIERDGVSVTPKGETALKEGDELVVLISQRRFSKDNNKLESIING
ncbi:MAG: ClC family H(+)/Cl(-) exchange transporter [Clostridium sp.]|nr:ClC family H(+)/Cl(-) exchange transporter [Clostridium sp.]